MLENKDGRGWLPFKPEKSKPVKVKKEMVNRHRSEYVLSLIHI